MGFFETQTVFAQKLLKNSPFQSLSDSIPSTERLKPCLLPSKKMCPHLTVAEYFAVIPMPGNLKKKPIKVVQIIKAGYFANGAVKAFRPLYALRFRRQFWIKTVLVFLFPVSSRSVITILCTGFHNSLQNEQKEKQLILHAGIRQILCIIIWSS